MSENYIKACPKCGAVMERNNFVFHCGYCNHTQIVTKEDEIAMLNQNQTRAPELQFEYIKKHRKYILQRPYVELKEGEDNITIICLYKFFGNDFRGRKVETTSMYYIYENNKMEETLFCVLESGNQTCNSPYLVIRLNHCKNITLALNKIENGAYYYSLDYDVLLQICQSKNIEISCNMITVPVNYSEFIAYSCRFYNLVFNKEKYIYSLNLNLLTDLLWQRKLNY